MTCDDRAQLLVLYAAGALDEADAEVLRAHLASGCPQCTGALAEARIVIGQLPLALDSPSPPADARGRLLAKLSATRIVGSGAPALDGSPSAPGSDGSDVAGAAAATADKQRRRRGNGLFSMVLTAAIAAVVAACVSGVAVWATMDRSNRELAATLQRKDQDLKEIRAQWLQSKQSGAALEQITRRVLASPQLRLVSLDAPSGKAAASGRVFWDRDHHKWFFVASNLPPPGTDKTYELWYIAKNGKKVEAGTFDVNASGFGSLLSDVPGDIGPIALAAVTDEPAGGVPQPTGSIRLAGKIEGE